MLVTRNVTLGVIAPMFDTFSTRAVAKVSAFAAVIEIGTFCSFSERRCAVTTIS